VALYLTEDDVEALVGVEDAIASLDAAFGRWGQDGTVNLPRQRLPLPRRSLNLMAASYPAEDVFGHKAYFGGCFYVTLYSISQRRMLALIEASALGAIRTGAASGVATRRMARDDARSVALIGPGKQGATQLRAVCAVRRIARATVFGRTAATRESFAREMSATLGIPVEPAADAESCVRGADVVITATGSSTPVVLGDWLSPGCHVNVIGANAETRREVDGAAVLRSAMVVVDDRTQARIEAAELIDLAAAGKLDWRNVVELGDIVRGTVPVRRGAADITMFKSLGIALEDVAFGNMIYRRALERGRGSEFGPAHL
jgi:ornithine cyclodeaminase/alanine dehydrogenase